MATTDATGKRDCSHIPGCELFPKFALRGSLLVWQTFYCHGKFEECARFKRSLSGRPVPPNLLPNGRELDLSLLAGTSAS